MSATVALTDEQQSAVEARGLVFVTAGAGSGKTRVLVERVARAVEDGVDPDRLVVVTFTERATRELSERVRDRLAGTHPEAAARVRISTIHGLCRRILQEHALAAGLDPDVSVLQEDEAAILRREAFDLALEAAVEADGEPMLDLIASYGIDRLAAIIVDDLHATLRSAGHAPDVVLFGAPDLAAARAQAEAAANALLAAASDDAGACQRAEALRERVADGSASELVDLSAVSVAKRGDERRAYEAARVALEGAARAAVEVDVAPLIASLLRRFEAAYASLEAQQRAVDFDDLQLMTRDLLERDEVVRGAVHDGLHELLVDEFQDTNRLQCAIFDLLLAGGAQGFFVGDEFQSIYRFRHSDVAVFVERREQAPTVLDLRGNFRSRPEVLAVVNHVFGETFGSGYRALVPRGSFEGAGFEQFAELLVAEGGTSEQRRTAEAALLARRIQALVETSDHLDYGDVVILLRAATDAHLYEQELEALGIRTHSVFGRGYYGRQQVLDLCAYLALLRNRYDDRALATVLASPLVGVSNDALFRLRRAAQTALWYGLEEGPPEGFSQADANLLRAFEQRFRRLVQASADIGLASLLERIVSEHDYDLACLARPDGRRRFANVRALIRLAREYEALRGPDIPGFLRFVQAQDAGRARAPDTALANEESDAVRLMTIHAAKGLEFPVCVVADCGRQSGFSAGDAIVLGDGRVGLRVPDAIGRLHASPGYEAARAAEQESDADELRRVLYVAATRAIDRLVLSGARGTRGSPLDVLVQGLGVDLESIEPGAPVLHDLPASGGVLVQRVVVDDAPVEQDQPAAADDALPVQLTLLDQVDEPAPASAIAIAALPPLEPLPAAPVHVPRELSFTALSLHEQCGYRYYSERVLGLPATDVPRPAGDDAEPRLTAMDVGSAVHLALELEDPDAVFVSDYAHAGAADRELIRGFVANWDGGELRARIGERVRVEREASFSFDLDHIVFRGYLDLVAWGADRSLLIVDYKTNSLAEREPDAIVAHDYRLQQVTYALAGLRTGAPEVEVCFAFLARPGALVTQTFAAHDRDALSDELAAAVERLRTSAFEPRPSPYACSGCGALDRICAGPRLERFG